MVPADDDVARIIRLKADGNERYSAYELLCYAIYRVFNCSPDRDADGPNPDAIDHVIDWMDRYPRQVFDGP